MGRGLFSIGEFSRMSRLSVKALRLYDEQGILRPGYTDPRSGYRYYSSAQLPEANLIRMLRTMEMPLDRIRAFQRSETTGERKALLETHRSKIEQRLYDYRQIIDSIERAMNGKEDAMERKIEIKELADQPVVGTRFRTSISNIGADIGKGYGAIFGYIGKSGAVPAGPPFAIYYGEEFNEDDIDMELCVPVSQVLPGEGEVVGRMLAGGKVASTLHAGSYQNVGEAYQALMTWMSENGYRAAGPPREVYLTDPNSVKDPSENRTEVVFPVEEAE
jgi:effector-binding domain-containing protein